MPKNRYKVRPLYGQGFMPATTGYTIKDTKDNKDLDVFYVPAALPHAKHDCQILNRIAQTEA